MVLMKILQLTVMTVHICKSDEGLVTYGRNMNVKKKIGRSQENNKEIVRSPLRCKETAYRG